MPGFEELNSSPIMGLVVLCGGTLVTLGAIGLVAGIILRQRRTTARLDEIRANGLAATATIVEAKTGLTTTQDAFGRDAHEGTNVTFKLKVTPPSGGNPYEVTIKHHIFLYRLKHYPPGTTVPVKVDPFDPGRVALDVDRGG